MHNLISFNQLACWKQTKKDPQNKIDDTLAEYFECLTECDENTQTCKRLCRNILAS